jgi:chemotaxis protein methyltransferase CheR
VTFRRLNLNDDTWPLDPEAKFDAVFCRNVLMYFEPGRRQQVLRKIVRQLSPQGFLFLGDAEGLNGFEGLRMAGPSVHTLRSNAPSAREPSEQSAGKNAT